MGEAPIPAGECHLWIVPIRAHSSADDLDDPVERAAAARFRHDGARDTYVTSRLAQRSVLERYLGAERVRVDRTCAVCGDPHHGRPSIGRPDLDYSVSHAGAWCLVAVAPGPVGVDIERTGALDDVDALAARTLSDLERAAYAEVADTARPAWFYRSWTRKEAAVKATGVGLRADLTAVDVRGPQTRVGDVALELRDLTVPAGYVAALATETPVKRLRVASLDGGGWPAGRQ